MEVQSQGGAKIIKEILQDLEKYIKYIKNQRITTTYYIGEYSESKYQISANKEYLKEKIEG